MSVQTLRSWRIVLNRLEVSFCLLLPVQSQLCVYLFLIVTLCFEPFSYPFRTRYPLTPTSLHKLIYSFFVFRHLPLPTNLLFLFVYEGKYEIAFIFSLPPMGRSQGSFYQIGALVITVGPHWGVIAIFPIFPSLYPY